VLDNMTSYICTRNSSRAGFISWPRPA